MANSKNRKFMKPLLIVVAMILVCVMSVLATLAYLTDTTDVAKNTFTVGDVNIKLDEAKVTEYGVKVDDTTRVLANTYKLVPNHNYVKDPTVTVEAGSEPAYVRMFVQITDLADVKAAFGADATTGYFLPQNFVEGWDGAKWITTKKIVEDGDVAYYEFRYATSVDALAAEQKLPALFTSFTVPGGIENDILADAADMQINVVAQAVQADGFTTVDAAFEALDGTDGLSATELADFFVATP